jgi:hypothetical protein
MIAKSKKQHAKSPRARKAPRARPESATSPSESRLLKLRKEGHPIRAIVKASARLADCIKEGSSEKNAQVIEDAKNATHRIFDPGSRTMIEVPDHKTRLAAVTLELAYVEGLPVKREISVQANFESGESVIERIKASPEAMRMLGRMGVQKSPSIFEAEITGEPEPEK